MSAVFSLYSPGGGTTSAPETAARIFSQADTDRSAGSVYCSTRLLLQGRECERGGVCPVLSGEQRTLSLSHCRKMN